MFTVSSAFDLHQAHRMPAIFNYRLDVYCFFCLDFSSFTLSSVAFSAFPYMLINCNQSISYCFSSGNSYDAGNSFGIPFDPVYIYIYSKENNVANLTVSKVCREILYWLKYYTKLQETLSASITCYYFVGEFCLLQGKTKHERELNKNSYQIAIELA